MAKSKICNCGCGTEFVPTKLGQKQVNQSHYITWLINTLEGQKKQAEAKEKAKKIIAKAEKKRLRQAEKNKSAIEWQQKANANWKKFKAEQNSELRSYQANIVLTKKVVQKWASLRDIYHDYDFCIACSKPFFKGERTNSSHFFKAELYSGTIFHPHNLNISCVTCNQYNDGNLAQYRPNLIDKISGSEFEHLEKLAFSNREFKYEISWLKKLRESVNVLIKKQEFDNDFIFELLQEIGLD
jgi:hypothetical protein